MKINLALSKYVIWFSFAFLVFLISFFYYRWFSFHAHAEGDLPYYYLSNLKELISLPKLWQSYGLGTPTLAPNWKYPIDIILGFFSNFFNLNFEILEKLIFFLPFLTISIFSLYFFSKVFNLKNASFLIIVLFFLSNTYILLLTSGGQMLFALGVAFFPAVFAIFHQAVRENTWFRTVLAAVFLAILSVFDPRVTYLALISIFLYYLFLFVVFSGKRKNLLINYSKIFATVVTVFLGLMAYWWLPLVITRDLGLPAGFGSVSQTKELSFATMANTLTSFQPFWPENIFGKLSPTPFYFFLLPVLAFSVILFRPKNKLILFFSFLALVGIFLAKGANEPLGEIYLILTRFFPGFSFFRDPTKFYVLIISSYSVLLAIFVQEVLKRIKKAYFRYGFLIILFAFLVFLSKEGFLGKLDGTFQPKAIPKEYQSYARSLSSDISFYRTFWLPAHFVFAYQDQNHPSIDAWDFNEKRPISTFITHFYHRFTYLDSPAASDFFDILGIRYLFVLDTSEQKFQNEKDRRGTEKSQNQLIESLAKKDWLEPIKFFPNAVSFENKEVSDHFWLVEKIGILIGTDKVYETLATLPDFRLRNFAFLAKEEQVPGDFYIIENPKETLVLNQNLPTILIYNLDSSKLTRFFVPKEDKYQVFARITKGRGPRFDQEEIPYGQTPSYSWQKLEVRNLIKGENRIKIPEEDIDTVMLIPQDLSEILAKSKTAKVEYQRINSTRYKIKIPKREDGGILAFSEGFHPSWRATVNGRQSKPLALYGLINGFPVDGIPNAEHKVVVEFLPQRIVPVGLGISAATLFLVLSFLFFLKRKVK